MNSNRYYLKDYFNKTDIFKDSNSYVIDNENKTSYFLDLDCGKGNIISYHVFNGIDLQFNSFNSLNCNQLRFTLALCIHLAGIVKRCRALIARAYIHYLVSLCKFRQQHR